MSYEMKRLLERLDEVGKCGVDAGCVMFVDPCYVLADERYQEAPPATYGEFLEKSKAQNHPNVLPFHDGFIISTLYGDGCYPVYIRYGEGGRPAQVIIDFEGLVEPAYDAENWDDDPTFDELEAMEPDDCPDDLAG